VSQTIQRAIRASPETIKHNQDPEVARDDPDDRLLNRKLAAESIVLLKNSEGVLPLDTTKIRKILVTGPNARSRTVSGGGSAYLTSSYIVTAWDGIVGALEGSGIEVVYTPGCYGKLENQAEKNAHIE
jgi:beta-glucosidase